MDETDTDSRVFLCQMSSKMLGTIHRPVLSSSASETDHQIAESASGKSLHMRVDHAIDMIKESEYFSVILQKINHFPISSCQFLIRFITSGVVDASAVKNIASTIP